MDLIVASSFEIAGRGTVVFFDTDPIPWLPSCRHKVTIVSPGRVPIEAVGRVEFARKIPPGEAMVFVFADLSISDLPCGTRIEVIEAVLN